MRTPIRLCLAFLALSGAAASAQTVVEGRESVATDSPEAWAMRYMAGTTLFTSLGETAKLAPWRWNAAADLGGIPRLSDEQQRVGFGGSKSEDLNKSPVFGRLRLALGLPHDWVAELGYTPPLEIDGARARNVFAAAIGRRLVERDGFTLSMRALGQAGKVRGDITCPARLAGITDPVQNPYGCQSPSQDEFTANYYGADATLAWAAGRWSWHASAGIARTRLAVQVDANVFTINDRTRLSSDASLPWFAIGVRHAFDPQWSLAAEWLHVPLDVRRPPDFARDSDPLGSLRVQLRYSPD
ncbi:MAG: hypothetical protein OEX21_00380 [Betaproteobacteria bacterium]|nr:hypothetical protein [Betaproteobacteria bacterium]